MSRVKGAAKTRRLLRRLPEGVQTEIVHGLTESGKAIVGVMRGRAPSRTGATRAALNYKVFPKTMKMHVGLLGSKKLRRELFYARILDLGRKAKSVTARRRKQDGSVSSYVMNVSPIKAIRFVTGPLGDLRQNLRTHLKGIFDRALARVAGGGE